MEWAERKGNNRRSNAISSAAMLRPRGRRNNGGNTTSSGQLYFSMRSIMYIMIAFACMTLFATFQLMDLEFRKVALDTNGENDKFLEAQMESVPEKKGKQKEKASSEKHQEQRHEDKKSHDQNSNEEKISRGNLKEEKDNEKNFKKSPSTKSKSKATIAYMISLTHCKPIKDNHDEQYLYDGAAVLKHSIHRNSYQNYEESKSLYDYKMFAIVHPSAKECAEPLLELGYELWIKDVPIEVNKIKKEFLRTKVVTNGCCGEKEYNKLWAYTVDPEKYPVAVHLDVDTLVVQSMDDLYDTMLDGDDSPSRKHVPVMYGAELPSSKDISAFFTRDYNMVQPGKKHVGVQGGFIVLRPDKDKFEEYRQIILEGKFFPGSGWGGLGYGGFYGGMTFQGLVPYFYDEIHKGTGVELNRCYYNTMNDNPRARHVPDPNYPDLGRCRDGQEECQDCRKTNITEVKTIHFTLCQKPWLCMKPSETDMCSTFHHEWFKVRKELDDKEANKTNDQSIIDRRSGKYSPEHFFGYCRDKGKRNYIPMRQKK